MNSTKQTKKENEVSAKHKSPCLHNLNLRKKTKKARLARHAIAHAPSGAHSQKKENEFSVKHFASQKLRFRHGRKRP